MNGKSLLLTFALVTLTPAGCAKDDPIVCAQTGFSGQPVCPASHLQLLGNKAYVGKVVRVRGYLQTRTQAGETRRILFFSKEQSDISNMSAAIEIGELSNEVKKVRLDAYNRALSSQDHHYVEIIGTFDKKKDVEWQWPEFALGKLVGVNPIEVIPSAHPVPTTSSE